MDCESYKESRSCTDEVHDVRLSIKPPCDWVSSSLYVNYGSKEIGLLFNTSPEVVHYGTGIISCVVTINGITRTSVPFIVDENKMIFKDYEWAKDTLEKCGLVAIYIRGFDSSSRMIILHGHSKEVRDGSSRDT